MEVAMKPKNRKSNPLSAVLQKWGNLNLEKRVPFDSEWNAHHDGCVEVSIRPYWRSEIDEIYWMLVVAMLDDESWHMYWHEPYTLLDVYNQIECGVTRDDLRKLKLDCR
jgi:hypothetical protein